MSIDETTFPESPCSSATPARTSTLSGTILSDHSTSRVSRLVGAERTAVARVGRHARRLPRSQVHDELPLAIMLYPMQRHANSGVVHEPRRDLVVVQRRRWRPLPSVRELRRGTGPEWDVGRALAVVVGGGARLEPLRVPHPVRKQNRARVSVSTRVACRAGLVVTRGSPPTWCLRAPGAPRALFDRLSCAGRRPSRSARARPARPEAAQSVVGL